VESNSTNVDVKEELKRLLPSRAAQAAWILLIAVAVWYHWSSINSLLHSWLHTEDYQHGIVVPFFSLYLLWVRRDMMKSYSGRGSLWGLAFFVLWALMRWVAIYYNYGSLSEMSLIPFFLGLTLFVGGLDGLHWAWPSVLFLVFMIPLPGAVQGLASEQLQRIATHFSVFTIQTLGIPAVAQGNVIHLTERPLEIARACSGLRMMMLFFAICIGAAFLSRKPFWERIFIVASAPPIAVLSNVIRIVITAVIYEVAAWWPTVIDAEAAGEFVHDWAGYLMMPIGLLLLLAEISLLSKLLIYPAEQPLVIGKTMLANSVSSSRSGQLLGKGNGITGD
jgi:exosortase